MTKDEALKMAIEALESITLLCNDKRWYLIGNARKACKGALEQPAWLGLSDDEIRVMANSHLEYDMDLSRMDDFARAIEQELKTKNGFSELKEKNT